MFKGTYRHKIDPKGRLPVPAAFRRILHADGARGVVLTLLDQCLAAYPPGEWSRLEAQLRGLPAFNKPVKALTRLLMSHAADCSLDSQGRILLPPGLREAARLGHDAVVVGVMNRFEVWAPDTWGAALTDAERLLDNASLDIPWPLPPGPPSSGGPLGSPTPPHPQGKPSR